MKTHKIIIYLALVISFFQACEMIQSGFKNKNTSYEFMSALIKEDYNSCMSRMVLGKDSTEIIHPDTMLNNLKKFNKFIIQTWGKTPKFNFIKWQKKFSNVESDQTPPNSTWIYLEIYNQKESGKIDFLLDDKTKKIIYIHINREKYPLPNPIHIWLVGLIGLTIPIFIIYVIIQLRKSEFKNKGRKYAAIILLNIPTLTYSAFNGFHFEPLSIQLLFGISFSFGGNLYSTWALGIPVGAIYWLSKIKLSRRQNQKTELPINSLDS